jgi:asparagine synthetase B (glutamine-hydrolysing)
MIVIRNIYSEFETPEDEWLRKKETIDFIKDIFNSRDFKNRKYWDYNKIKKIWHDHINKNENNGLLLWKIILLEMWLRIFIKGKDGIEKNI